MAARFYKCPHTGNKLPSVTTICGQLDKPALVHWAANCACDYILDQICGGCPVGMEWEEWLPSVVESSRKNFRKVSAKALDIGSAVHAAIERYLRTGQEPEAPSDEVLSAFLAFLEWKGSWGQWEVIELESTVYSEKYAGTCDLIVGINNKFYVVDFKSSKAIYNEMRYQIAAYRNCLQSMDGCGILRLDKESGTPEWVDTSNTYEKDLKTFLILTDLWYATH